MYRTLLIKLRSTINHRSFNRYNQFGKNLRLLSTLVEKMAEGDEGLKLKSILDKLEEFAPKNLAESWDNVGLLMDPLSDKSIKNVLLTNDLTEDIVSEAAGNGYGLIISYHPPIFRGMKSVTGRTWKERLVVECIKNDIAVFSPHTSWDVIRGGVNDWLAKAFDVKESTPVTETGCGRKLLLEQPIKISDAISRIKKHIGIPHIQLAIARNKTTDDLISSVALCAGSGAAVLGGVPADLYLTGEMSHHEVLDATQNGINVILCNHSNTERGFLKEFAKILRKDFDGRLNVEVSKIDRDPLTVV